MPTVKCPQCQSEHAQGACQPWLVEPVAPPAWRSELHERVASYRARHQPPPEPETRVVRMRPVRRYRTTAALAEPVADPVSDVTTALPEPAPAPKIELVSVPARPAPEAVTDFVIASAGERLPLLVERERSGRARDDLLQIPLPLAESLPAAAPLALPVASRQQRLQAGAWDAAMVGIASLLFAGAAWAGMGWPALAGASLRVWLPALVVVPGALGALYLAASFATGTCTWGMRRAGLRLAAWEGEVTAAARQRRAWGCVISLAALGLGFVWMFCDSQQLTWHDYVSRTYLADCDE